MKQISIRNVPDELARALDRERRLMDRSLNQTVIDLLQRALGLSACHDFDNGLKRFAGRWSDEEFREFEQSTKLFDDLDEELWR